MKKLLFAVALATTLALSSCSEAFDDSRIWDKLDEYGESIKDHEKRIAALEELCKQMNTNISSLQTLVNALEKRDYITSVAPVRKDGEVVGYTITFANSDTITIYHGEDGKDGANGKDGYTPQIGVMKDTDGIYYWTLDGEWLLDAKGNKIKAQGTDGQNGTNGNNGTNGSDGQDGITPRLKIENDYWYVSYDNGITWQQLGKATGEDGKDGQDGNDGADGSDGADGEDGKDGDSIFKSVTQDDEYVYFNLSDGTMITLPKHDKENIQFEDLQVKAICCKNWDTNKDGELSYAEAAAVTTIGTKFRENTDIVAFTEFKYFSKIIKIEDYAFSNCANLWKIEFPQKVESIGINAFSKCRGLSHIVLSPQITMVETNAFYLCDALPIVDNIRYADTCVVGCNDGVEQYAIREGTRIIGYQAFCNNQSLSSITIPDSVVTIACEAFKGCYNLANVTIGNGIARIESGAFLSRSTTSPRLNVYCKAINPPSIYVAYYQTGGIISATFPTTDSDCTIYVPRDSYNAYKQYSNCTNGCYQNNWYEYSSQIKPYDFE